MVRNPFYIVAILFIVLLSVCLLVFTKREAGNKNGVDYIASIQNSVNEKNYSDINSVTYSENGFSEGSIKIIYPQITGTEKNNINTLIKNEALSVLKLYDIDDFDELSLDIDYEIPMRTDDIISIIFKGNGVVRTAAHPNKWFYTVNVDLKTGEKVHLSDFISDFAALAEEIKKQNFVIKMKEDEERENLIYVNETFPFHKLERCDFSGSEMYSYFADGYLGISFGVAYAIGGHQEIMVSFENLR